MKQALLALLFSLGLTGTNLLLAQKLTLDAYQVTVVTKAGDRSQGILDDVTTMGVYCDTKKSFNSPGSARVFPLENIRKVILRRTNRRRAILAGVAVGGIAFGLVTIQGLEKNPTRSSVIYGLTILLGAGTGAAIGAGAGSIAGNLSHRVIRPRNGENSLDDFRRQLEPFSVRYQNDLFNRVNQ